jgi:hypothetical protein
MPRQNFLNRESFVNARETTVKESLLSIPVFANNIKLDSENKMLQKVRFLFEQADKKASYWIDVSVLPLNDEYTRISLHATHTGGQTFHNAPDMAIALHDFESAIGAALNGDTSLYQPTTTQTKNSKSFLQFAFTILASAGILMLKKKLS